MRNPHNDQHDYQMNNQNDFSNNYDKIDLNHQGYEKFQLNQNFSANTQNGQQNPKFSSNLVKNEQNQFNQPRIDELMQQTYNKQRNNYEKAKFSIKSTEDTVPQKNRKKIVDHSYDKETNAVLARSEMFFEPVEAKLNEGVKDFVNSYNTVPQ